MAPGSFTRSGPALRALLFLLLCSLCTAACQTTPAQAPSPTSVPPTGVPSATPSPRREQIHFSEDYLSELAYAYTHGLAHDDSDRVTRVTVNVQSDQEIHWKLWALQYCVDVMIDGNPLMGSHVSVEDGRVSFPLFDLQWLGLQFTPEILGEPLTSAIYGLQEAVSEALDQVLSEKGWVPVAVTADDEKLIVTVEER